MKTGTAPHCSTVPVLIVLGNCPHSFLLAHAKEKLRFIDSIYILTANHLEYQ